MLVLSVACVLVGWVEVGVRVVAWVLTEFTETGVVSRSQQKVAKCCLQQHQASLRKWKVRFVNDFIHMLVLFTEPKSPRVSVGLAICHRKVFLPNAVI